MPRCRDQMETNKTSPDHSRIAGGTVHLRAQGSCDRSYGRRGAAHEGKHRPCCQGPLLNSLWNSFENCLIIT